MAIHTGAVANGWAARINRMSGAELIIPIAGFILALMGFAFGVWKYVDGKISEVRKELSDHRLHSAETFATKAGMQEQTNSLLRAIEGIASRIDGLGERIDNIILRQPRSRT